VSSINNYSDFKLIHERHWQYSTSPPIPLPAAGRPLHLEKGEKNLKAFSNRKWGEVLVK
jgi:hypothetical protein